MTKEELENKVKELEAVVVEKDAKIVELEEANEALKKAAPSEKKGAKETKIVKGLKVSIRHSGKTFLAGTKVEATKRRRDT